MDSTFDSKAMTDILAERERWTRHTHSIKNASELSEEEALAENTRRRMELRAEMHEEIKHSAGEGVGLSKAIAKTHSDVYRGALRQAENAIADLKERETKDRMIETCIVHNEQYFKKVNLTLRMHSGSVVEEHRVGNVDTSILAPLICPEQMQFFKKVKELGVIVNKAICNRNNVFIASPKNMCESIGNLFVKDLLKKRFPPHAPAIHLTLTHDTVTDYTEVERTSLEHITAGAFVDLSFSMNSQAPYAFADCVVEYILPSPADNVSMFEWLACQNYIDDDEIFRVASHYTMYYNFGGFILNNAALIGSIFIDESDQNGQRMINRAWFQIFRDSYIEKYTGDRARSFLCSLAKLDNCAADLPELSKFYVCSPRVAMFHVKRGQRVRKFWFCVDAEWPEGTKDLQIFIVDILGRYKNKTANVVASVPDLPAHLNIDKVEDMFRNFDANIYTKPVRGGECVAKIFLDAKKPTKMIVC